MLPKMKYQRYLILDLMQKTNMKLMFSLERADRDPNILRKMSLRLCAVDP